VVNSPVAVGWSSCLGTLDFPQEYPADQAGLPNDVFPIDTGEVMAVAALLPTTGWSIADRTA